MYFGPVFIDLDMYGEKSIMTVQNFHKINDLTNTQNDTHKK